MERNSTAGGMEGILPRMAFRFEDRIKSFSHAFRGVASVVRTQHNAWIHSVATVGVVVMGFYVELVRWEWCMLAFAIGLVWVAEALNTAIEFLADEVSLEKRELIGKAKDAASAGVLMAAICSVVIGLLVFVPHWF
jgi:diacylglycerol kinase (ATP)